MSRTTLVSAFLLWGCAPEASDVDALDTEFEEPARTCESEDCVREGVNRFDDGEVSRRLHVWLPAETRGAPVLFVWHHLGGSPDELLSWMPLDDAVESGFIVVAPKSRGLFGTEWDVYAPPPNNEDVKLFDAVLDSLVEVQGADPQAYVTGFSAGGLFSTFLTLHRADALAASAPFSGGAPAGTYVTPSHDVPVMLSWGGASDTFGGFDFQDATLNAAAELAADGHVVLTCDHGLGHWLPADAASRTLEFFETHIATGEVPDLSACERR